MYKRKEGAAELKGFNPKLLKIPACLKSNLNRNKDMFDVMTLLKESPIVQIFGIPGVGKSTLARSVASYIGERGHYRDGVCYINMANVNCVKDLLNRLSEQIMTKYANAPEYLKKLTTSKN